jgi:proline iminopeptidase
MLISDESRDMKSYDYLATTCLDHDVIDELSSIKTPTLVMAGKFDPICSMTAQKWMVDALPDAELTVFEKSSHFFLMEESLKALSTIENWLEQNS